MGGVRSRRPAAAGKSGGSGGLGGPTGLEWGVERSRGRTRNWVARRKLTDCLYSLDCSEREPVFTFGLVAMATVNWLDTPAAHDITSLSECEVLRAIELLNG